MSCNAALDGFFRLAFYRLWHCMEYSTTSGTYPKKIFGQSLTAVRIRAAAGDRRRGWLIVGHLVFPVALGRGGIRANKREGDGATPRGIFRARRLWWRADRHLRPKTFLPVRAIRHDDGWCEDPASRHYNRPVRLARRDRGDRLARVDHLYDFIVEIDHNTSPRVAGFGSAVFLHLARKNFAPTAGCVSMTQPAMLNLLRRLGPDTRILIG
jgi:L,D-peptidoglycan transpeptidase YkuD (ErfK/YbiS/YcfS/YnhG family)